MEEITLKKSFYSSHSTKQIIYKVKKYFSFIGLEASIWITALLYLAIFSPVDQTHFTICPLANAGFKYCPGCGLGLSITQFFHGKIIQSFHTHPLGFFALVIIIYRIFTIIKNNISNYKKAKA